MRLRIFILIIIVIAMGLYISITAVVYNSLLNKNVSLVSEQVLNELLESGIEDVDQGAQTFFSHASHFFSHSSRTIDTFIDMYSPSKGIIAIFNQSRPIPLNPSDLPQHVLLEIQESWPFFLSEHRLNNRSTFSLDNYANFVEKNEPPFRINIRFDQDSEYAFVYGKELKTLGVRMAFIDKKIQENMIISLTEGIITLTIILILIAISAIIFMHFYIQKPFERVLTQIDNFSITKLSNRVEKKGINEFQRLSTTFNRMASHLEEAVYENDKVRIDLERNLKEKTLLIQEIHHRVKNNLQVIEALLRLQEAEVANEEYSRYLQESYTRIHSMALVHQLLYSSDDLKIIPLEQYLHQLLHSYGFSKVSITLSNPKTKLDLPTLVPLGLIVNELAMNTVKHGQESSKTHVQLKIQSNEDHHFMEYEDNGPGLSETWDIEKNSSLGIEIIQTLAAQLSGEASFIRQRGFRFQLSFKNQT
jgi:two-component sensor histidine kinase